MKTKLLAVLVVLLMSIPCAASEESDVFGMPEFSLSIGYANVRVGGSSSELHSEDAIKFDPVLSFSPIQKLPQLRLGLATGFSLVLDNSSRTLVINGGQTTFVGTSDVPLWFFEPEARLSWRQSFGSANQFFIEPGIAAGGVFGWLDLNDKTTDKSISESDSAFQYRAFLYAGARVVGGTAGLEASWMQGGNMHFADNAKGDVSEFYIGIFGALQF